MNKRRKGSYYRRKVQKYFQEQGYQTAIAERNTRYSTRDLFGADLIAMSDKEIIFIQVKSNKADISKAKKEFKKYVFPKCKCIRCLVALWLPYHKEPTIMEVK